MSKVTITLCPVEREALIKLALTEVRTPRDQARYILRRELKRAGLLPPADQHDAQSQAQAPTGREVPRD